MAEVGPGAVIGGTSRPPDDEAEAPAEAGVEWPDPPPPEAASPGCMGTSQSYGTVEERDERESIATIHRDLDLGVTLFDTAEAYDPYASEELLARAMKARLAVHPIAALSAGRV